MMDKDNHQKEKLSIPPGFESLTTFTLRREEPSEEHSCPVATKSPCDPAISSMPTSSDLNDSAIIKRSLQVELRPWIVYDEFQSEGESDSKQHDMSFPPKGCLPKGVIRGCPECDDCQKISARWDPEGACTYMLEEAPVFHPNEEEFKDTFKYIESIRQRVEPYGFCRIVPPPSWELPCFLEESDIWQTYKFPTQIQRVNELQNHCSYRNSSTAHDARETKRRKLEYEFGDGCAANFSSSQSESGPQFTLIAFKRYADYFQECYFSRDAEVANAKVTPPEENIEGEYWRIVENPTHEIEVLHGIDLDSRSFCSGFPESSNPEQASDCEENFSSGWNVNYISRLPDSLLSFETSDSSSILAPRGHVGMCFSSLPWTVEEHHLYKLYYLHLGAPRIWYGISGCDSHKYEALIKSSPGPAERHPEMRRIPGRQLSPATLKSDDIRVYRCIQRPREFVLCLAGAYHSGFDCGFNLSASAVFAPLDWLPHGQNSIEVYRERRRKTSISHDKVLLRAANEAVKAQWEFLLKGNRTPKIMTWKAASGKNGTLAKALRARIRSEARCRDFLASASQSRKMDESYDSGDQKKECVICYFDLYLSAAICSCNPDKYSCLKHTKQLCCSCPWSHKVFLFRYLISELNTLADAVEGKFSAVRNWVKEDFVLALQLNRPKEGPSSVARVSDDRAMTSEKHSEASPPLVFYGDLKGKVFSSPMATGLTSSDVSDDEHSSSSESSESDVEAYVERLKSRLVGEYARKTTANNNERNVGESSVAVKTRAEKGSLMCDIISLTDDDDEEGEH